jgi:UDP-N-acetylglucosamine 2-epimerase
MGEDLARHGIGLEARKMQFVTIVGTRPQFIKAAALSIELRKRHEEYLVHTGQHYDDNMSAVFFRELGIPPVDRHLAVGPGKQGAQTGKMLERIEAVLEEIRPDAVIVFGDTNSTLAGVLAAAKLDIPVAHVEAGLRAFTSMPEEVNRVVTDRLSRWRFAPSARAVHLLAEEGIRRGVFLVGDIMADCLRRFGALAGERSQVLDRLGFRRSEYAVATLHRRVNITSPERLASLLGTLGRLHLPVVLPLHPHTAAAIRHHGLERALTMASGNGPPVAGRGGVYPVEPLGYFDMIELERHARLILTDSGGMQKEAYYLGVPCITLREETEWRETVDCGWNRLVGADPKQILAAVRHFADGPPAEHPALYGDGSTGARITELLSGTTPADGSAT